jgi:hypothetical protein
MSTHKQDRPRRSSQFRETMWFKQGDAMASPAAPSSEDDDAPPADPREGLPIEDRYNDDGSLTHADSQRYSLRTGATAMMPTITAAPPARKGVSERELLRDINGSRPWFAAALLLIVACASAMHYLGGVALLTR